MKRIFVAAALLATLSATATAADGIVRYPIGSSFPIARAVSIPAGFELIFHSGFTPSPANPQA
jgi:hypothetical protein